MNPLKGFDAQEIVPGLYLGSARAAKNESALRVLGLTHIVCLAGPARFPSSFVYMKHHFSDSNVDITPHLSAILPFIEDALANGGKVLVHCLGGISRSAAVVVAYLIKREGWTTQEAIQFVQSKRANANPIRHFLDQLNQFEIANRG